MGVVYRAEDLKLGRHVALKFLPDFAGGYGSGGTPSTSASSQTEALARFEREARAASALNHPGICTIYEIDQFEGRPFIAMELLEGRTVRDTIARAAPSPLPADLVISVGIQIADALDTAHRHGVIHRDIKPANLFINERGLVKLLDFGLAKQTSPSRIKAHSGGGAGAEYSPSLENSPTIGLAVDDLTSPGGLVGTIAYMSPEQALGEPVDGRTDIFSLGAVLYELATSKRAFAGATMPAVANAILSREPEPVSVANPALPEGLGAIIEKALAKNRDERYQSAAELRDDLKDLQEFPSLGQPRSMAGGGNSVSARVSRAAPAQGVPSAGEAGTVSEARGNGSNKKLWAAAGIGVLALLGLVLFVPALRRWVTTAGNKSSAGQGQPDLPAQISLAVLPATAEGGDPHLIAFGNGLIATVTARLVQFSVNRSYQVIPASEIQAKKVNNLDRARQEFGANLGLEFDIQSSGGLMRVSYTLIDAKSGRALRADSLTVPQSDLLALEDRVVESAARALGVAIRPEERQALRVQGTLEPSAYDYYLQGLGYLQDPFKAANVESSLTVLGQALHLDPGFGLAEAALGEAYWHKYELSHDRQWVKAAHDSCERALQMGNAGAEGHECLGVLASGTGHYAQAADQFRLAVQLNPTDDRGVTGLADVYQDLNQPILAEQTYQRAINLRPQYWGGYSALGALYVNQEQYDKAAQMFQRAVSLAPDSYRGYANLGGAYLYLGRRAEAIQALERSIAILPTWGAYSNLGTAHFQLDEYDKAAQDYQEAVKLSPIQYALWGNLGNAQYYAGHRDNSAGAFRKAIELVNQDLKVNPNDSGLLGDLAGYYSLLGERTQAFGALDGALNAGKPDRDLLFNACLIYNQFGETSIALEWLAKALAAGYSPAVVSQAPGLNNLHNDSRYQRLLRGQ